MANLPRKGYMFEGRGSRWLLGEALLDHYCGRATIAYRQLFEVIRREVKDGPVIEGTKKTQAIPEAPVAAGVKPEHEYAVDEIGRPIKRPMGFHI
jgi:hypothetical protein